MRLLFDEKFHTHNQNVHTQHGGTSKYPRIHISTYPRIQTRIQWFTRVHVQRYTQKHSFQRTNHRVKCVTPRISGVHACKQYPRIHVYTYPHIHSSTYPSTHILTYQYSRINFSPSLHHLLTYPPPINLVSTTYSPIHVSTYPDKHRIISIFKGTHRSIHLNKRVTHSSAI